MIEYNYDLSGKHRVPNKDGSIIPLYTAIDLFINKNYDLIQIPGINCPENQSLFWSM